MARTTTTSKKKKVPTKSLAELAADKIHLKEAVKAVTQSGLTNAGHPKFSLRAAAKHYDVPRSTLQARYNGRLTGELVLKKWIGVMAKRGVPLTLTAVAEYASSILGEDVPVSWARAFRARHPGLKACWTTGLESCCARCLNRALVLEYFDILEELQLEYNFPPENIYNMDEKGIQMGVGVRQMVLVDRDQKTVYHVEDGNRELVTVIETTCADGTTLPPSVIYKGKTRDLEWGRNNPCEASISFSPKGWTDNELGSMWLERDFEPETAARNVTNGWRLLILDSHNSHCTYTFCHFAELHRIIILCLVAHTTHRCQPNDVTVFGPLASSWKAQIMTLSRKFTRITKYNLLQYYDAAQTKAMTPRTILAAFRKTGIFPFNRTVIEDEAFEPAKNTTTQSAQPVAAALPDLLRAITVSPGPEESADDAPTHPNTHTLPATPTTPAYALANFPSLPPPSASRAALLKYNASLAEYVNCCKDQMAADFASKQLMDAENGRLREELFAKKARPAKQRVGGAGARHMTAQETLEALAFVNWKVQMVTLHTEFSADERVKSVKATYDGAWKEMIDHAKQLEKDAVNAVKAAEREAKKADADAEKARKKVEVDAQKAVEKVRKTAEKEMRDAEKVAEKAAEKARKEVERAEKQEATRVEKERKKEERHVATELKKLAAPAPTKTRKWKRKDDEELTNTENLAPQQIPDTPPALKHPRPQPVPMHRGALQRLDSPHLDVPDHPDMSRVFGQNKTNWQSVIDPALV
ncbi:DDE superfamily endonuclease-domain-containing protein [Mycena alexandri]|uniref:DDE superfamily endonuclease-domain-containing protein n=1 Tax=Mycena alexandri TaxID=1745969 RepID=A0AAD6SSR7_9AGAR|nr:DDE superfamily endonuclease-domain-containing protein [Mycena alexandri]